MKMAIPRSLFFTLACVLQLSTCVVIINELMYNPRQNSLYEFIELYNNESTPQNISGWKFTDGITFTFPPNSVIPGNGFVLVVPDRARFARAYPQVTATVFGDFSGKLDNSGEKVSIVTNSAVMVTSFKYTDSWYPLTDGFGPSLELICPDGTADPSVKTSWRSGILPVQSDPFVEFSGTPGSPNSWVSCPVPTAAYVPPPIFFSEIMYHPNNERSQFYEHAWFEIYNNGENVIDLSDWRVGHGDGKPDGISFIFPTNILISPNQYLVVAKNVTAFKQVWSGVNVIGNYNGEIYSGDNIAIADSNGQLVEEIEFDDKYPWPLGPDAYASGLPNYKGFSLERVSFDFDSSKKYNWVASLATPGAQNAGKKDIPDPVVTEFYINDADPQSTNLNSNSAIRLSFKINPSDNISSAMFEYFLVNGSTNSVGPINTLELIGTRGGWFNYTIIGGFPGNTIIQYRIKVQTMPTYTANTIFSDSICETTKEDGVLELSCPPYTTISEITFASYGRPEVDCEDNTYQPGSCRSASSMSVVNNTCFGQNQCSVTASNSFFGDPCVGVSKSLAVLAVCSPSKDPNNTVIFPRINDPNAWNGLFVSPDINTKSNIYHLFITSSNWQKLFGWTTFYAGSDGCPLDPTWDNNVPAYLGYKGVSYPVTAELQGSFYNRFYDGGLKANGRWNVTGPLITPPGILSWSIKLPNWAKINGVDKITIQKPMYQGCTYMSAALNFALFKQAGLPAPNTEYARFHINGQFYNYGMVNNGYSAKQLRTFIDDEYDNVCDHQASEIPGTLYKASGFTSGVIPRADEGKFGPFYCKADGITYSTEDRVSLAYSMKSNKKWAGYQRLLDMIDGLAGLSLLSPTQARTWFYQNFDVNQMLSYVSIINWSGAWDDRTQNHYVYQRVTDGKWVFLPWDMDGLWFSRTNCSMYIGECGVPVCQNAAGACNILKSKFIYLFRNELNARTQTLKNTILSYSNIQSLIENIATKQVNATELMIATRFSISNCTTGFLNYQNGRSEFVTASAFPSNGVVDQYQFCPSKPTVTPVDTFNAYQVVPGKPSAVSLTVNSNSSVSVNWNSPNSNNNPITSFELQRLSEDEPTFVTVWNNFPPFTDETISNPGVYTYRVRATNSVGNSVWSDESGVVITSSTVSLPLTTYALTTATTTGELTSSSLTSASSTTEEIVTTSIFTSTNDSSLDNNGYIISASDSCINEVQMFLLLATLFICLFGL